MSYAQTTLGRAEKTTQALKHTQSSFRALYASLAALAGEWDPEEVEAVEDMMNTLTSAAERIISHARELAENCDEAEMMAEPAETGGQ